MSEGPLHILLVEDNQADARLIQEHLSAAQGDVVRLRIVPRLEEGSKLLERERFDCVLVDLTLPDSAGIETAMRILEDAHGLPVIVLTGALDEGAALTALRRGVTDYLLKSELTPRALMRAIRYAQARHALDETRQERDWLASELQVMERISGLPSAPVTAKIYGSKPLREVSAALFRDAVTRYGSAIDDAVQTSIYKVENRAADQLRDLAVLLARVHAGARDVVDIHTAALRVRTQSGSSADTRAAVSEARLVLLDLMGRLLSLYRSSAPGSFSAPPRT